MRPRFTLHLAAILALAVGVCWGALARSRPVAVTGADVKRLAAAHAACALADNSRVGGATNVPAAGLFAALPDGSVFRPVRNRAVTFEAGIVMANFWGPALHIYVGPRSAWCHDGRGWLRADLAPADAERVRSALLAALAAAQAPPSANPPGR